MPIVFMAASIAALAFLARIAGRRPILTVLIGVVLFTLLTVVGNRILGISLSSDYAVFWFSVPAILLALMFAPRRHDDALPSALDAQSQIATFGPAASGPVVDEKAFQQWLAARGLLGQSLTPEQLQSYRRQAAGEG